jgi:hypothetical protein
LRKAIDELSEDTNRIGTFRMVLRYRDVFGRCFELGEKITFGQRNAASPTSNELYLTHVLSEDREISQEEYNQPIQLPPPE